MKKSQLFSLAFLSALLSALLAATPAAAHPGESSGQPPDASPKDRSSEDPEETESVGTGDETDAGEDGDGGDEPSGDFNADSVYERPFITGVGTTSVGGYVEGSVNHTVENGIPEGPSFELRRFNIFVHSTIGTRMKFISELEFEHGTEEIALETAQLDYKFDTAFQVRFGIILPPIGAFNQNHDAPAWEFVDRPLVATELLPATLSEPGGGFHGKFLFGDVGLSYQLYATNGLGPGIAANTTGRTSIPAGKREGIFEEDNNPVPAVSGRVALRHFDIGELGVSAYWSRYNNFNIEGTPTDTPRDVTMVAVDYQASIKRFLDIRGELAWGLVDTPEAVGPEIGARQFGAHVDLIGHVWRPTLFRESEGELNLNLRAEAVDYNLGTFETTGGPIGEEVYALVPGVSFRPVPEAVFRTNYRREWHVDLRHNAPAHKGVFQLGVATYF